MKAADRVGLTRLSRKADIMTFRVWRDAVERWARVSGGDMDQLTSQEVADAAPRLLAADLHAEMVAAEKVEVSWGELLLALQWMLGLNPDALLHSLLSTT